MRTYLRRLGQRCLVSTSPLRRLSTAQSQQATAGTTVAAGQFDTKKVAEDAGQKKGADEGLLRDEYGKMDASGETYFIKDFTTQKGYTFPEVRVRYKTWGTLNEKRDNVMVIHHALTGNADVESWWGTMLGPGKLFDTDKYFVFCANIIGSCYGTTGPTDVNPDTGEPWMGSFPEVTIRDSVRAIITTLKEGIGANSVAVSIGGSLGGMQVVEMLAEGAKDGFVRAGIPLACGGRHHAWQIGISELQRQAIYRDPNWKGGHYEPNAPPLDGLNVARQIAMISYRSHPAYQKKFARKKKADGSFEVESYLRYQGQKFLGRFDVASYVATTKKMDTHDVADGREGTYEEILGSIKQPVFIVGISSDALYPVSEQQELASLLPNSEIVILESLEGHDGFLLEQDQISNAAGDWLKRNVLPTISAL